MFLGGLSKIEEEGGSAIVALDEIGITELRMSDATLRAGGFDVHILKDWTQDNSLS